MKRWVGIARVSEGEEPPDGLSIQRRGAVLILRLKFLRLIGVEIRVDREGLLPPRFMLVRRGWGELWVRQGRGWIWIPVIRWEMHKGRHIA